MTANQITRLSIAGMSCTGCSGRVKAALESVPGVRTADVDLASGTAIIETEPNGPAPEALAEIVTRLGYEAEPVTG